MVISRRRSKKKSAAASVAPIVEKEVVVAPIQESVEEENYSRYKNIRILPVVE